MTKHLKLRLIRMRTAASGPDFSLAPGETIELSAERAAELVEGLYAEYADVAVETAAVVDVVAEVAPEAEEPKAEEPKAEPEPEVAPEPVVPEAASLETAETAVIPAARGRRRGQSTANEQ